MRDTWLNRQVGPSSFTPWTPFMGALRSIIALGTLATMLATSQDYLFRPMAGVVGVPNCSGVRPAGLYCLLGPDQLGLGRWLTVATMVIVISGWLPQVTSLLHVWVVWSVQVGISIPDGGDQIAVFLAAFLVPVCLTDPRWNSWSRSPSTRAVNARPWLAGIAWVGIMLAKAQMTLIYLDAAVKKSAVQEWQEGTFMYYLTDGFFSPSGIAGSIYDRLISYPVVTASLTWGTIVLEFLLAGIVFYPPVFRKALLKFGLLLHLGIAFMLGIVSFQFVMIAGLVWAAVPTTSKVYSPGFSAAQLRYWVVANLLPAKRTSKAPAQQGVDHAHDDAELALTGTP